MAIIPPFIEVERYADEISETLYPRHIKMGKINWYIVQHSHIVCKVRGAKGHQLRQEIRKYCWEVVVRDHPELKRTLVERILGLDFVYRIKKIFRLVNDPPYW